MGLVNFAHGQVVMIGAYAASTFYMSAHLPFFVAIPVAMVVTGLIGLVIERVLRPLENKDFDLMLIGTIGFGMVLEALATIIWGATGHAVPSPVDTEPLDVFGIRIRTYSLVVLGIAALATVALVLFLQRTKRGAAMQAVAMDHEAATAVGIHVGRSNAIAFAIGAGLAALAGALVAPDAVRQPDARRIAGHQGVRRGDPRRLRQHPGRDRGRPRDRRARLLRGRPVPGATRNWWCSWCSRSSS